MDRPQFTLRSMLASVTYLAMSCGCFRAAIIIGDGLGLMLCFSGVVLIGAGLGAIFNRALAFTISLVAILAIAFPYLLASLFLLLGD